MPRGVVFDFNGTLARPGAWRSHREVFARHGLAELAAAWGESWDHAPADGECHEDASRTERTYRRWELSRWRTHAVRCGVPESRADALVADLDRETKAMTMQRYADALPTLTELRRQGFRTAVCSNWHWDLDAALRESGLDGQFTVAVTSARAGMRKPDPRIYRATLGACGLVPEKTLFVGDMWGPDVAGPRAIGMPAALLWRAAERAGQTVPPRASAVWRIGGLDEVVPLARELL
ncbi:hypothetical protein GCM10010112_48960 [Actinoplanes lobatus]|uniref:Putative hydrolase of the HAD superfamily n=1 Tax=Actinoplanes lobatus TaxID=113568 RepID=A0A7W7HP14_9ACTN|nr:HAD-IA family hydrolase [Actinoplanes lobatus]MBB4754055.1 putative hydrolase of the HAD superfamily [Actinoplanes lobatus]GGN76629.1 hypothetical protein GCM10010112_48960 [Actinoplanes lobatus]GIE40889.1 hypothetical protein Alo02nite_37870 [Actinoplanes lobatus]